MKKILVLLLALFVTLFSVVCFSSCNETDNDTDKNTTKVNTPEELSYKNITGGYEVSIGEATDCDEIVIPAEYNGTPVISIADSGFTNSAKLKKITLPDTVTTIGKNAFTDCRLLEEINIPENVTSIGKFAFSTCFTLSKINYNAKAVNDLEKTDYIFYEAGINGDGIKLTVGKGVTRIPAYAFYAYSNYTSYNTADPKITSIVFEEGSALTSIGEAAFSLLEELKEVRIESIEKLISIDYESAGSNPMLCAKDLYLGQSEAKVSDITIPESITAIKNYALCGCSFTSVTIPSSVTSIGEGVFSDCYVGSLTLPNSVTAIGKGAFASSDIESIVIPSGVTTINEETFAYSDVKSITIPSSVTVIKEEAFNGCGSLEKVYISDISKWSATDISSSPLNNGAAALYIVGSDAPIKELVIPEGTTHIPAGVYNSSAITKLTIPSTVNSIENGAFRKMTALTELNYNAASVDDLSGLNGIFVYAGQKSLGVKVTVGKTVTKIPANFLYPDSYSPEATRPNIISVEFEEDSVCTSIGNYAFYGLNQIKTLKLGSKITSIGKEALFGLTSLESISIPFVGLSPDATDVLKTHFGAIFGYTSVKIDHSAYPQPTDFHYADYKNELYYYFNIPKNLKSVEINGTCEIKDNAFYHCTKLTDVTVGNGVSAIGEVAFNGCTALTELTIGSGTLSIGNSAFANCTNLTDVTVGSGVTSIGWHVFTGCKLGKYNQFDNAYYIGSEANPYLILIKAIDTSIDYCNINANTKFIYDSAFSFCSSLTGISIPNGVTHIGEAAFNSCNLNTVILPNTLSVVGLGAFSGNPLNYSANDGDLYYLGSNDNPYLMLFRATTTITSCTINDATKIIYYEAFSDCDKLTSINIPADVIYIGYSAFLGCDLLASASFEVTSGWYDREAAIPQATLASPSDAATALTTNGIGYYGINEWYRK